MTDHAQYEELAALEAGGHLTRDESDALHAHLAECAECRRSVEAYRDLVGIGLPLVLGDAAAEREQSTAQPEPGARERFLARAAREGIVFSPEVDASSNPARRVFPFPAVAAFAAAAAVVLAVVYAPGFARRVTEGSALAQELERLRRENSSLTERLTARDQQLAGQQEQLRKLQGQLATASAATTGRGPQASGFPLGRSTSQEARLLEELQNRDRQLTAAADEISRITQLRSTDRAALDAQSARLRDAFDQLRVANATIDMERELAAAGRDILDLVRAKQLRVVDVRDTDANGRPGAAFARVFLAEGRSIRIFAFDLNEGGGPASARFQVWGEQLGDATSVRSLGVLSVDDRRQNRWSLTIPNAAIVRDVNSVFVTAASRGNAPEGPRLLYALLGPGA